MGYGLLLDIFDTRDRRGLTTLARFKESKRRHAARIELQNLVAAALIFHLLRLATLR